MRTAATQNSIFLEQDSGQCGSDQEIQYQKSSSDNQNEYISQFLNNERSENLQQINNSKFEHLERPNNHIQEEKSIFSMENKQNLFRTKKRQKSCFHNFQKHLIITLRNIIKVKRSVKPKETETIAYEIWNVFTRSTLYGKKFLHVLFGVFGDNEENQFSKNFLNNLGFMEIFAKYTEDCIIDAQKYLRKKVISQMQKLNLQQYLHYRKLKRVEQFKTYIEEFLEQLREGSVRKRLPKERKIEMMKMAKKNGESPDTYIGA